MSDNIEEIPAELLKELEANGYCFLRMIPGRGICGLSKLMYTVGIVYGLDMFGYNGRYCYHSWHEAIVAFIPGMELEIRQADGSYTKEVQVVTSEILQ